MSCLHYILKFRVAHEFTRNFRDFITSRDIFELIVRIVPVAIEKFSIQSAYLLALLIHHSNEDIRIIFIEVGSKPFRIVRIDVFILGFEEGQEANDFT